MLAKAEDLRVAVVGDAVHAWPLEVEAEDEGEEGARPFAGDVCARLDFVEGERDRWMVRGRDCCQLGF